MNEKKSLDICKQQIPNELPVGLILYKFQLYISCCTLEDNIFKTLFPLAEKLIENFISCDKIASIPVASMMKRLEKYDNDELQGNNRQKPKKTRNLGLPSVFVTMRTS